MDGIRVREVSGYDIANNRRYYRWDVSVYGAQLMFLGSDVKPGQLEEIRTKARESLLPKATASLPLVKGSIHI